MRDFRIFAGIAGGLYAINYEIVTYDAVSAVLSANVLLMTFIGGIGVFWGPILGAVLITLLQSWMSLLSDAWVIYIAVLFIVMVIYAPGGIAGLIMAHLPIWRSGRLVTLAIPYLRIIMPTLVGVIGFVGLVELAYSVSIGKSQGKALTLLHHVIDTGSPHTMARYRAAILCGHCACRRSARAVFRSVGSGGRRDQSKGTGEMNAGPAIVLRDVHKSFGATKIIDGVNLRIWPAGTARTYWPERCWKDHAVQYDLWSFVSLSWGNRAQWAANPKPRSA